MINYAEMEKKWQKAWADANVFEVEPNDKPSLLVTAAIPYVNAPPHMGHVRTYGTADTFARYMRMKGINVLYPFGFHATGTPLVGFAKRIAKGEKELIDELRIFHVPDEDIKKMTNPAYIADYFIKQQESEWIKVGIGIDWRRKFISTEPMFSKFIEWQFYRLKDKGYLTKGTHPVGWCPNEGQAVGQHDTMHDVQPKIEEITVVKFKDTSSNVFFPCATYRPETIYGVTNIFVKDDATYVIVEIDNEQYYLSKEASFGLSHQLEIKLIGEISGKELLGKRAINPINNDEVPVLPGFFVKTDVGTGIVMSVPAHAPFDYAAIERLKQGGYPVPQMRIRKVIDVEKKTSGIGKSLDTASLNGKKGSVAHPEIPALAYLELMGANHNALDEILEVATKAAYKEESHFGIMMEGKYEGKPEAEAREGLKGDMAGSKMAFSVFMIANPEPVICRCGFRVMVNIVRDQWFINYGDEAWKKQVRGAFKDIAIYPEKYRRTFESLVEWIEERATERSQGLGTKFPFNPDHIIESLSDSTIYMTFYTYVPILRSANVKPEQLKPEFFDHVINSIGNAADVAKITEIDEITIKKCKESIDYWYVNTSRHSGPDLIPNHLLMYVFNHVALLPEKFWPKRIVVNGFVNYEGQKMSKSLGNIIPAGDAVAKYGADVIRLIEIAGGDLDTETEFRLDSANSVRAKNEFIMGSVDTLNTMKGAELEHIDYWLYSKINTKIRKATESMDKLEFRGAYTEVYYNTITEMKWYLERGGHNQMVMRDLLENTALMISPIMPHFAEELWQMLGNTNLVARATWPTANEEMINEKVEEIERVISDTTEDISSTAVLSSKITANNGKRMKEIRIIIPSDWKSAALNMLIERKEMSKVIDDPQFQDVAKDAISKFLSQFMKRLPTLHSASAIDSNELLTGFLGAKSYIKQRHNAEITIEREQDSKSARASRAMPGKPSIDITWA